MDHQMSVTTKKKRAEREIHKCISDEEKMTEKIRDLTATNEINKVTGEWMLWWALKE